MNTIKAAIFDLDGTLYDKRHLKLRIIWNEIRTGNFLFLLRERSSRVLMRGRNFGSESEFYHHFFHNISPRHPEQAEKWYMEHYLPLQVSILHNHYNQDYWVQARLAQLHKEGVLCVVYSDYGFVNEKLRAIGLDPSNFDAVFDAPSLGGLKPSRKSTLRLLDKLQLKPDEVLFVGDRPECDVAAAKKIGAQYELLCRKGRDVFFTSKVKNDEAK